MSKETLKKVGTEIEEDILINIKILALRKKVTLSEYVAEILIKHVQSKSKQLEVVGE